MLRSKIEQTNAKISQLMNSALQVQMKQTQMLKQREDQKHDDILDASPPNAQRSTAPPANDVCPDLIKELADNLNSLVNFDLSGISNSYNLQHLLKATNHLKIA